jgi:hypothetical protein
MLNNDHLHLPASIKLINRANALLLSSFHYSHMFRKESAIDDRLWLIL